LSIDEIRLLTNEIFARNGYHFENGRFQNYFEDKKWYKSKNDNNNISFNEIEKQNIKFFQERTKQLKANQEELIKQLKDFKTLVIDNNRTELKRQFNFLYESRPKEYDQNEEQNLLIKVLSKIDFSNINYYKNRGLNSVMIDNGFVRIVYEISIESENINIYYNYMSHSKIIQDFDEFTDYHSEDEYMYNWQFEFKNNKLRFVRLAVAG
jgi:hypothetical protein